MREKFLPFHVPEIGEEEIQAVVETLRSGWLTTGPRAREFEKDFSTFIGCKHAISVNSGTAALHLALDAVGIKEGDEVLLPAMTFAATAEVVLYGKARPVLVDCCRDTFSMDPGEAEAAITPRTRAIIPVHFGGHPCDMDRILDIAKRHHLRIIEDAAHSLPARYHGSTVGAIGDVTCFSFYATKTITTGEGGMITTENEEWAERMRIMSLHGISKDAWKRYTNEGTWCYEILYPGYKYNMTDIAAAIGIQQLKKCSRFWEVRRSYAEFYNEQLADLPEVTTPCAAENVEPSWHLFILQLNLERLRINRNEFIELMRQEGIGCSVHFIPLHLHPYYREHFRYRPEDFPNSTWLSERIVSLPIYPKMTRNDLQDVIDGVKKILTKYHR